MIAGRCSGLHAGRIAKTPVCLEDLRTMDGLSSPDGQVTGLDYSLATAVPGVEVLHGMPS